ncbi:MAG: pyrroline-5-carboxylate reductase [bacterium]
MKKKEFDMLNDKQIVFLGAGNMAEALIKGIVNAKLLQPSNITATDIKKERLEFLKSKYFINTSTNNKDAIHGKDIIILAVKPQTISYVLAEIADILNKSGLIISIAAGITTSFIKSVIGSDVRVIRVMPNMPALVSEGVTAIAFNEASISFQDATNDQERRTKNDELNIASKIFNSVGQTVLVNEKLMDAVTALSGSGPAYIFLIIEALIEGGVKMGLSRDIASILAAQTVFGSTKLLIETKEHPAKLKDMVTSPGGTTASGLYVLEKCRIRAALIEAVEAATKRARELG